METTFYLKYRPQTFSDLDSTFAREELIKIFSSQNIPHAFLFTGTKGIGKTSAARIVAKAVNCTTRVEERKKGKAKEINPCNKCSSCISITNGSNIDVLEIDAASYTGVDDIRDLREKVRLASSQALYKVYIIDEVHRLSGSAFDALLKTIEEPPKYVIFILCTTEIEKVPKTIVSRCHRITFKKATEEENLGRLKYICEKEKISYEEKALLQIAKLSDGSFRDATKILEQVAFSGKITEEEVQKTVGILGNQQIDEFLHILKKKDIKEGLIFINNAVESGANLKVFLENFLDSLRNLLLANYGIGQLTETFSIEETKTLIELFSKAYTELRYAVIPQLPIEIAVIEWGENQLKVKSEKLKVNDGSGDEQDNDERDKKGKILIEATNDKDEKEEQKESEAKDNSHGAGYTLEDVIEKWPLILNKVKPMNHSVLAFLRACRPKSCEDGFLTLEVFYKFHKDQLESEKCRRVFETAAGDILSCNVKLKCSLSENKPVKMEEKPLPPVEMKTGRNTAFKKAEEIDIMKVAQEIFK